MSQDWDHPFFAAAGNIQPDCRSPFIWTYSITRTTQRPALLHANHVTRGVRMGGRKSWYSSFAPCGNQKFFFILLVVRYTHSVRRMLFVIFLLAVAFVFGLFYAYTEGHCLSGSSLFPSTIPDDGMDKKLFDAFSAFFACSYLHIHDQCFFSVSSNHSPHPFACGIISPYLSQKAWQRKAFSGENPKRRKAPVVCLFNALSLFSSLPLSLLQ